MFWLHALAMKNLNTCLDRLAEAAGAMGARGPRAMLRRFLDGVFWILRTGAPWRDLPPRFGGWNTVFRRFRRWSMAGRWERLLACVSACTSDDDVLLIDSTIVKAHPDAAGARSRNPSGEALGRSRGGFTTKIHALVSTRGRWVGCCLTPGQRADITQAIPLLIQHQTRCVVGDRAYDSDALLDWLEQRGSVPVVPARRGRRAPRSLDVGVYTQRNVIERFFGRLKRFRRVGTRYDKTACSFSAFVGLGAMVVERTAWA